MIHKKFLFLLVLFIYSNLLFGQTKEKEKRDFSIGTYFSFAFPKGELKNNIGNLDNLGTVDLPRNSGFTLDALFQSRRDDWLYMGFDVSFFFLDFETQFLGDYDLITSNYVMNAHYKIHLEYDGFDFVRPYIQGQLGAQYFFTRTIREDITEDNVFRGGMIDTGDLGASFGGTIGVQLKISRGLYFDGNLSYLRGTPTEYLVRRNNAPFGQDPIDSFEPRTSPTDLLLLKVGVRFGREK